MQGFGADKEGRGGPAMRIKGSMVLGNVAQQLQSPTGDLGLSVENTESAGLLGELPGTEPSPPFCQLGCRPLDTGKQCLLPTGSNLTTSVHHQNSGPIENTMHWAWWHILVILVLWKSEAGG